MSGPLGRRLGGAVLALCCCCGAFTGPAGAAWSELASVVACASTRTRACTQSRASWLLGQPGASCGLRGALGRQERMACPCTCTCAGHAMWCQCWQHRLLRLLRLLLLLLLLLACCCTVRRRRRSSRW